MPVWDSVCQPSGGCVVPVWDSVCQSSGGCVKHDGDLAGRLCVQPSGGCVGSVSDLSPVVAVLGL